MESGDPCSWPSNLGSVITCQIEYGESDAMPRSELGRKKLAASACWLLGYSLLNPATCFEEAQGAQGEAQLKRT